MIHWWSRWADQHFGLEATDRADIGLDLRALEADESGKENYTLFKAANLDDMVLHDDGRSEPNGIVGGSTYRGECAVRAKYVGAFERPLPSHAACWPKNAH